MQSDIPEGVLVAVLSHITHLIDSLSAVLNIPTRVEVTFIVYNSSIEVFFKCLKGEDFIMCTCNFLLVKTFRYV